MYTTSVKPQKNGPIMFWLNQGSNDTFWQPDSGVISTWLITEGHNNIACIVAMNSLNQINSLCPTRHHHHKWRSIFRSITTKSSDNVTFNEPYSESIKLTRSPSLHEKIQMQSIPIDKQIIFTLSCQQLVSRPQPVAPRRCDATACQLEVLKTLLACLASFHKLTHHHHHHHHHSPTEWWGLPGQKEQRL